ncbi:hypothetical protein UlMin_032388 [Ulmus minor]
MGFGVASWRLLLRLLVVLVAAYGSNGEIKEATPFKDVPNEDNYIRLPSTNHVHAQPMSHMDHMDHNLMIFFTVKDLKVGKTMAIYFPKKGPSTSPPLLPRDEANKIPFSLGELPKLLKFFSFSHGSPQATAMEDTLRQCETQSIKGETKFCATSFESMIDFTRGVFGLDESRFSAVTTTYLSNLSTTFQNFTILDVQELLASKMVTCHVKPYPYAIYYCHIQESENKLYKISLGGENGDRVEAVAVCHMDTSQWSGNHVSFKVLGTDPGALPVCHFFPAGDLVWIPKPTWV